MANILTNKLGPLPTWGWAALGVGGFVLFRYLRSRSAANPNAGGVGQIPISSPNLDVTGLGDFNLPTSSLPVSAMATTSGGGWTEPGWFGAVAAPAPPATSTNTNPGQSWGLLPPRTIATSTSANSGQSGPGGQHRIVF